MTYGQWVMQRLNATSPRNQCAEWTRDMVARFPELRRVRGHIVWPTGAVTEHWWCVAPDGSVVDPTATQFASAVSQYGMYAYLPLPPDAPEPTGKCMWCGGYIWPPRSAAAGACSDECAEALEGEYRLPAPNIQPTRGE